MQASNSRLSRPISSATTSKLPVKVVNGKSRRVSVFGQGAPNSIVIAKWLRTIIRRRQKWPVRTLWPCPLHPHRAAFCPQPHRVVTYRRFTEAFPTSIFSHYKLWKSNTGVWGSGEREEMRNTLNAINMYPIARYFQRIILYSLLLIF